MFFSLLPKASKTNVLLDYVSSHLLFVDCTGLPWLGELAHLAPVADFGGAPVYAEGTRGPDDPGISPFPVRDRLDQPSYQPPSSAAGWSFVNEVDHEATHSRLRSLTGLLW